MMPVPSHLKYILYPRKKNLDEGLLIGDIKCSCGSRSFHVMYPGATQEYEGKKYPCTIEKDGSFFFVIKVNCSECNVEYTLFDRHFHGWNGFLCHDSVQASLPRPELKYWYCQSCNSSCHEVSIKISSQGKSDFMDATGGEYDENKWPDAFEWIWITIKCSECGLVSEDWVDYETM